MKMLRSAPKVRKSSCICINKMLTITAVAYFAGVLGALDPKFLSRQQSMS